MASSSSLPVLSFNPIPKIIFGSSEIVAAPFSIQTIRGSNGISSSKLLGKLTRRSLSRRLNAAGLSEIEPDLNEDPVDRWETNSVSPEDFEYGVYDGHHTYFEGEKKVSMTRSTDQLVLEHSGEPLQMILLQLDPQQAFRASSLGSSYQQLLLECTSMFRGSIYTLEQLYLQ
ncbi:photosynthetic NDH subunit of subcomplex B 5, chloroplastic isoform X3 [Cucumis melo]|uniref:Photosynthetic NDH subunit of subcomplex B 5, chloroplastic isoform X3 n=1 Tax=Cucumis melo TaxID=3656 RepID=A0ABM3KWA9_CUCME|nr:photosynthetic NDH subunit of subcomplex B 5, chloroplastic isoform X3 [Cucumis melo]